MGGLKPHAAKVSRCSPTSFPTSGGAPPYDRQDIALFDGTLGLQPNAEHGLQQRRMESERAAVAAKEAEARRALGRQILEDAERLVST